MLKFVVAREELARVQEEFAQTVRAQPHQTLTTAVKFRGGPYRGQVLWIPSFGIWAYFGFPPSQKANRNRFWNVFGLGKPGKSVRIVCEVNSPFEGVDRSVGGAFAADEAGRHFVLHRGTFHLPGMTKDRFWDYYKGATAQLFDGPDVCTMALVAALGSPYALSDLAKFIREVGRVKGLFR
jgi:hypothetical protein